MKDDSGLSFWDGVLLGFGLSFLLRPAPGRAKTFHGRKHHKRRVLKRVIRPRKTPR